MSTHTPTKPSIPRHCESVLYMLAKELTRQHTANESYDDFCGQ